MDEGHRPGAQTEYRGASTSERDVNEMSFVGKEAGPPFEVMNVENKKGGREGGRGASLAMLARDT